jgi:hypothetical protein
MTKYNVKRQKNFKNKSVGDLTAIAKSGSLSAAAAKYELKQRGTIIL